MKLRQIFLIAAYFLVGAGFIFSDIWGTSSSQLLFKALIMPLLIVFFLISIKGGYKIDDWLLFFALLFAWAGDVLLQLDPTREIFFLEGLGSFLVTQVLYSIVFFRAPGEFDFLKAKRYLILIVILFGGLTIYTIMPSLGNLLIPVTIYAIVITGMVFAALSRYGKVSDKSYLLVFIGAFLFLISDSLIAFNKFKQAFPHAGIIIMAVYIVAQFLIVLGYLKAQADIDKL
jgi:uncharacterized membrane protein YhhN